MMSNKTELMNIILHKYMLQVLMYDSKVRTVTTGKS